MGAGDDLPRPATVVAVLSWQQQAGAVEESLVANFPWVAVDGTEQNGADDGN